MIAAHAMSFAYDAARPVLRGIDLEAAPGELVALFGPNGAGKTTLLRLLAGDLAASGGAALVDGRDVRAHRRRDLARLLAVVPQEPIVSFPYTVGEVVLMGRAPRVGRLAFESEEDVAAARLALEALDLWPLRDRPIGEVSGGERQRAAIARALAQETPNLLLDEPTAFLDVRHQVDVCRLLRDLARDRGRAILVASHDVSLVAQYATRVALLKDGAVRASGAPEDVLRADLLKEVFEADVEVARHGKTGRPYIVFGGQ